MLIGMIARKYFNIYLSQICSKCSDREDIFANWPFLVCRDESPENHCHNSPGVVGGVGVVIRRQKL